MARDTGGPDRGDTDVVGSRIGAQVVDTVLMVALLYLGYAVADAAAPADYRGTAAVGLLLGAVAALLYGFLLEGYWDGYTVGKRAFGIRVVTETGGRCGYRAAFVRNLLELVDGILYYLVGFVAMALSDRRQRVGDRVAGTVVVRDRN